MLSPSKKDCFISFNEIPLEMIKNNFYLSLEARFVLKMFEFLCQLLVMLKKRLD